MTPGLVIRGVSAVDVSSGSVRIGDIRCPAESGPTAVIDGAGLFALPGLIDMHAHVVGLDNSADMVESALTNLRLALKRGITTVRDLGMPGPVAPAVLARIAMHPFGYPRLQAAGPALTAPGGHGDTPGRPSRLACPVADQDEALAVARRLIASGADVIKLITGSGSAPRGFPELSSELMRAVVAVAHQASRPVAVHANFRADHIERALDAGCDTLEHGTVLCDIDPGRLRRFADRGGAYTPTLSVLNTLRTSTRNDEIGQRLREKAIATWSKAMESVLVARRHGIAVLAGTDSGAAGVAFGTLHEEIRLLAEAGLSHLDALRAATAAAERYLTYPAAPSRAPSDTGSDFILVRANPIDDLGALDTITATVRAGKIAFLEDETRLE